LREQPLSGHRLSPKKKVTKEEELVEPEQDSTNTASTSENEEVIADEVLTDPLTEALNDTATEEADKAARKAASSIRQKEDRLLVSRARAGDQQAFFDLVRRHRHGVERLIRPMVRSASSDELEDLVQEALTKAMLHIQSYSEEYAFSTWLYRIATNHAIDYLRKKKLNAFSISSPPVQSSAKGEDESREYEISDQSWVPEEMMLADERTRLIDEAIEQLPDNYRRIIKLRHSEDMEYEEIAKVLKIPMGTVKVHLHRARAALARMLEGKI
jgi:RNA polymerase sigma-70 factor (ECF subfamily)